MKWLVSTDSLLPC